jgi:hypothetical protein
MPTAQYFPLQTVVIVFTVATELLYLGANPAPSAIIVFQSAIVFLEIWRLM